MVYILFHQARWGVLKVELSIVSIKLVDSLSTCAVFLFLSEFVGEFLKSLQLSSWILWGLVFLIYDQFMICLCVTLHIHCNPSVYGVCFIVLVSFYADPEPG